MQLREILKFNPFHDGSGRFSSANSAHTKDGIGQQLAKSHKTVTPEEVIKRKLTPEQETEYRAVIKNVNDKIAAGQESHKLNQDKNGKYTPERVKLHRKILKDLFAGSEAFLPKKGEKPEFLLLGGRGGSGKSSFEKEKGGDVGVYSKKTHLVIDPDHLKQMIPGFHTDSTPLFHEESAHLADKAIKRAKSMGINVVFDRTMKSPQDSLIVGFKKKGFKIGIHYMHLPPEKAAERALGRWLGHGKGRGRNVPVEIVLGNKNNEKNFDRAIKYADDWSIHSNDVPPGTPPKLIGRKKMTTKIAFREILKSECVLVQKFNKHHGPDGRFTHASIAPHVTSVSAHTLAGKSTYVRMTGSHHHISERRDETVGAVHERAVHEPERGFVAHHHGTGEKSTHSTYEKAHEALLNAHVKMLNHRKDSNVEAGHVLHPASAPDANKIRNLLVKTHGLKSTGTIHSERNGDYTTVGAKAPNADKVSALRETLHRAGWVREHGNSLPDVQIHHSATGVTVSTSDSGRVSVHGRKSNKV